MCESSGTHVWEYRELRRTMRRGEVDLLRRSGRISRVRRGIYAGTHACTDVVQAAAHGGVLACESAARHLGLWVLETTGLHVWVRSDRHQYPHGDSQCDCIVHWDDAIASSPLSPPSVPRVLQQIHRCGGDEAFFVALESARRMGMIDVSGLRWLRRALNARGRRLVEYSRSDSDSGLESLIRLRLRGRGWSIRTQAHVIGTGRVDLLIDGWLIIEADGRANHDASSLRHKDLVRDANAAAWHHPTLRFDYAMIMHDWDLVERAIVATMERRPR